MLSAAPLIIEAGCLALTVLSLWQGEGRAAAYLAVMLVTGAAYLAVARRLVADPTAGPDVRRILLFSLLFYCTLLPGEPLFDNDVQRYLWEGKVTLSGTNPYLHTPRDPALGSLRDPGYHLVGYPGLKTPYPPAAQALFAAMRLVSGGRVWAAKAMLGLFFAAGLVVLLRLLEAAGADRRLILLYAWNPLVLKEFANSGHLEPVSIFFMLAAMLQLHRLRDGISGTLLAAATLTKLYPLFALPFLALRSRRRVRFLVAFAGTTALGYLPFLGAGRDVAGSLGIYVRHWLFNHGFFEAWRFLVGLAVPSAAEVSARFSFWVLAAVAGLLLASRVARGALDEFCDGTGLFLFALVVLSPTVMPWYLAWSLPLLIFRPRMSVTVFTLVVQASYLYYLFGRDMAAVRWAEHGVLAAMLAWEWLRREGKGSPAAPVRAPGAAGLPDA